MKPANTENQPTERSENNLLFEQIEKSIQGRFDTLQNSLKSLIDEKLNIVADTKSEMQDGNESIKKQAFPQKLSDNGGNIETAFRKNSKLTHETERARREKNIIIHRVVERRTSEEEHENSENTFVKNVQIIGANNVTPLKMFQLGTPNESKKSKTR